VEENGWKMTVMEDDAALNPKPPPSTQRQRFGRLRGAERALYLADTSGSSARSGILIIP
jgi:hypothetical protein